MPLLKEFELIMPLRTSINKETRRRFELQTRCVTSLYERLFPKFKTETCWKISVECVADITNEQFREALGVGFQQVKMDVESFFSLPNANKKEVTLKTLQIGINKVLDQTNWSAQPFLNTYQKAKELQLINHWVWKKPVWSPSRKLKAEIFIQHEVEFCDISMIIYDRNGEEVKRKTLISELPDEWAYTRHLGKLTWESKTKATLSNKKGTSFWYLNI